jgi:tetraacyldisaccharide 4'-kinase
MLAPASPEVDRRDAASPGGAARAARSAARLRRPVISIGNLAMGGRGKTPLVALVARMLLAHGERPAILSRGYHRRRVDDGVVVVSDGRAVLADLDHSGDEPLMLAEQLPGVRVLVSDSRTLAGALAERALGATVHILDDGFQHRALARDVDIVLVAPEDLTGRRLPFGRLREGPSALARADAVVLDGPESAGAGNLPGGPASFRLRRALGVPVSLDGSTRAWDRGQPVVAVAGLAHPERFQALLEADGWHVTRLLPFRDHQPYTPADVAGMARAVRDSGAVGVVTTAKDAVRLRPAGPSAVPVAVVPLEVAVDPADAFQGWLLDRLSAAGRARA